MNINLLITILNRGNLSRIRSLYEKNGISPLIMMLGSGTATPGQLRMLGLDASEKALIAGVINGSETHSFFNKAKKEMMIDVPGNGVMMTVPIKSIVGGKTLAYMTNGGEPDKEKPTMEFNNELIVVVLNSGFTDDVMDTAREAGAGGGTVIHAKGTGAKLASKFFGVNLAEEKEVLFIAERKEKKSKIMQAIAEKMGPQTSAGAICFSLPISEIAGIRSLED